LSTSGRGSLIERVAAIVVEVSAEVIEPRFGALGAADVHAKSPGEQVTVADLEAEVRLTRHLGDLLPGVPVVGEEACAADPAIRAALAGGRAWLVDPVDGTDNFIAGRPDWAVMVALVEHGETVASCMWCPVAGELYLAERGAGATRNGIPLTVRSGAGAVDGRLRGSIRRRFLDGDTTARLAANAGRFTDVPGVLCAAVDYPVLIDGTVDFILYWRTLPWDHAPATLLTEEAGGVVARLDGRPYRPTQDGTGLLVARSPEVWERARRLLD
jgi:fructose-1,6-bisphosphatase/inositol monophosphatase family enzyme